MNAFELYLLSPRPEPVTPDQLLSGLRAVPWTRQQAEGPRPGFYYLNPDTGVYFSISAPILDAVPSESGDAGEESATEAPADDPAEDAGGPALELAAITLSVAPLSSRIIGAEAANAAASMAEAAGLEATGGDGLSTAEEIAAAWESANQAAAAKPG